jgi:hypothetical protein
MTDEGDVSPSFLLDFCPSLTLLLTEPSKLASRVTPKNGKECRFRHQSLELRLSVYLKIGHLTSS